MRREKRAICIRISAEMKQWLDEQVIYYGTTQGAEISRAIRERMERVAQEQRHAASLRAEVKNVEQRNIPTSSGGAI